MTTTFVNPHPFEIKPTAFGFFNFRFYKNGVEKGWLMNTVNLFKDSLAHAKLVARDYEIHLTTVEFVHTSTIDQYKYNEAARILTSTETETGYDWTMLNIAIEFENGDVLVFSNEYMPWREDRTIYSGHGMRVEILKK